MMLVFCLCPISKVLAGLGSSEASFLGLQVANSVHVPLVSLPLVIRTLVILDYGPILTTSF